MLLEQWIHQWLEQIVSVLGVFEDKPGKVNSCQFVNNQFKMESFVRWLGTIKHLSNKLESSSGSTVVKTDWGAFYQIVEREPEGWVFIIRQRASKYQWLTTMTFIASLHSFSVSWSSLAFRLQLSRLAYTVGWVQVPRSHSFSSWDQGIARPAFLVMTLKHKQKYLLNLKASAQK